MKRIILTACVAAFLFVACNSEKTPEDQTASEASSESADKKDKKKEEAWIPIDSATGMKAMMEHGTPGEPHKMLAKANGTWTAEITMWMADGAPPEKATGTAVNTMIYGDRYQQSKFTGNFMGMPFEGTSITGYDNTEKKYFSTWFDNMSTSIMNTSGTMNEATNTITLTGKQTNPANKLECNVREVLKMVDDNTQVMEMYGPDPQTGKEYKMMEIKYTRKK